MSVCYPEHYVQTKRKGARIGEKEGYKITKKYKNGKENVTPLER